MKHRARTLAELTLVAAAVVLFTVAASGQSVEDPRRLTQLLTRKDQGEGGVQVTAVFLVPEYARSMKSQEDLSRYEWESSLVFEIAFDTHSVALSGYDPLRIARLRGDGGEQAPTQWQEKARSSHHISGVLLFPRMDAAGQPIPLESGMVDLVIQDVARVKERVLRWELPIRVP